MRARPFIWLLFLLTLVCGCRASRSLESDLPRPPLSYLHWLQKESLQNQAPELIAEVSQSGRVWLQGSQPGRADALSRAAPNWLGSLSLFKTSPPFRDLWHNLATLPKSGIEGLYLGDMGEKTDLLHTERDNLPQAPSASLKIDPALGTEEEYAELAEAAETAGIQIGATLLPGATGQGPDFLLQARNVTGHEGIYAMLPLPNDAPHDDSQSEWDFRPLHPSSLDALPNIASFKLARDNYPWASPGGWAATGAIAGRDGTPRRWLYRYSEAVNRPTLAWQDPSGRAAAILSAAVIKQTGLMGQTLAGLSLEPLMGLEPAEPGEPSLSPGLDALNALSRQIHRYGGWACEADPVPESVIRKVLTGPCDFCRDDLTPLLVAFGLLAADGRPVAALYRSRIADKIEISRMIRCQDKLRPRLLLESDNWREPYAELSASGISSFKELAAIQGKPPASKGLARFELVWLTGMPGLVFLPFELGNELAQDPWLVNTLLAREETQLAAGQVISVIRGRGGGLGLVSRLPSGRIWLLGCNFGVNPDLIEISLPPGINSAKDAGTRENLASALSGVSFRLSLDGHAARNVLFE